MTRVLITGGAGFIGSHTSDLLLEAGYQVRLLDNLMPQVHGPSRQPPVYLNPGAELTVGDVTDHAALDRALRGVDLVLHLASTVGVGQSMYDMVSYVRNNEVGTIHRVARDRRRPTPQRPLAHGVRGWSAAAGFRPCSGCRERLPTGAGVENRWRGLKCRLRAEPLDPVDRERSGGGDGQARP